MLLRPNRVRCDSVSKPAVDFVTARADKLETIFNGLLRGGLCPERMIKNALFMVIVKDYLDGKRGIAEVLSSAKKINILAGNKYSEKMELQA